MLDVRFCRKCYLAAIAPLSAIQRCLKAHLGVGADTVQSLVADKDGIQVIDDQDVNVAELIERVF